MLIYNYSRTTSEYIGPPVEAKLDPVGKNPMIPAYSTHMEPPTVGANRIAVFNAESKTWNVEYDYRGTEYYLDNGTKMTITQIGEVVPDGVSLSVPPDNMHFFRIVNGSWAPKPIEEIREMKISEAYAKTASLIDQHLGMYSAAERETWAKMYDECLQYNESGVIGPLMQKKISVDPEYNTAQKLANMTVAEYIMYVEGKFHVEAQRSQHKINIISITDPLELINYDTSVSYNT